MENLPVDEIVKRYEAGERTAVLGRAYGVHRVTVWRRLRAAGVALRYGGRKSLAMVEVAERYEAGESTRELGQAYGVSHGTIWNCLRAADVKMRPSNRRLGQHKRGGPLHFVGKGYLSTCDRDGEGCLIHRGCWEAYHGPIPVGHIVHHENEVRVDNRIENLACMTHGEHRQVPGRRRREGLRSR